VVASHCEASRSAADEELNGDVEASGPQGPSTTITTIRYNDIVDDSESRARDSEQMTLGRKPPSKTNNTNCGDVVNGRCFHVEDCLHVFDHVEPEVSAIVCSLDGNSKQHFPEVGTSRAVVVEQRGDVIQPEPRLRSQKVDEGATMDSATILPRATCTMTSTRVARTAVAMATDECSARRVTTYDRLDSFNLPDSPMFHQLMELPRDSVILRNRRRRFVQQQRMHRGGQTSSSTGCSDSSSSSDQDDAVARIRRRPTSTVSEATGRRPRQHQRRDEENRRSETDASNSSETGQSDSDDDGVFLSSSSDGEVSCNNVSGSPTLQLVLISCMLDKNDLCL